MIETLPPILLKNGDTARANLIVAPEETWRKHITDLLHHKGEMWCWQIARLLDGQPGIESRFFFLHQNGEPFCNILTIENNGVGLLGHVWTKPENRGQGAASQLMRLVMKDFQSRSGRALFLGTGYESAAFHIYRKQGFASIEKNSGVMAFFRDGRDEFESDYFAIGETKIAPLNWPHYATTSALLTQENKTRLRCAPLGVLQPSLCESAFLPILREREIQTETGAAPRAFVLQKENGAVAALAAWREDTLWPNVANADIFCHANFWQCGEELLKSLALSATRKIVIYDDQQNPAKTELLRRAGFEKQAQLKKRVAADVGNQKWLDVVSWERDGAI